MSITVKEKEHWKERIAKKIEHAIQQLVDQHDPQFMVRITEKAWEAAIQSLGGTQDVTNLNVLEKQRNEINDNIEDCHRRLGELAKQEARKPTSRFIYSGEYLRLWNEAVESRQERTEKELLSHDPLGKRILKLRSEQEGLLDTVWLSTSTVQIRQLWSDVMELLVDEPSDLQKNILLAANRKVEND